MKPAGPHLSLFTCDHCGELKQCAMVGGAGVCRECANVALASLTRKSLELRAREALREQRARIAELDDEPRASPGMHAARAEAEARAAFYRLDIAPRNHGEGW